MRTVLKQNDNTEGRWVPMAERRGSAAGGGQHSALRCTICPSALGFPITLLAQELLPLDWAVWWLLGCWASIAPITQCCPAHLQDLETHLFDVNLQEWMKLTLTLMKIRSGNMKGFNVSRFCLSYATALVTSHTSYAVDIIYHRFFLMLPHF